MSERRPTTYIKKWGVVFPATAHYGARGHVPMKVDVIWPKPGDPDPFPYYEVTCALYPSDTWPDAAVTYLFHQEEFARDRLCP